MVTLTQLASSTEPVQFQVAATQNGAPYNPTGDAVAVAFIPDGQAEPAPASASWQAATWETDPGGIYWASILVGPLNGGVNLAAGTYLAYIKVTDNPAVPIRAAAFLRIT
jgi:hypothetical protein